MVYYISDTHFGHENIIRLCNRPFQSVEEMNAALLANWNRRVKGNDTVYILGDLFYKCEDPEPILQQLKGKKRLILGNHDGSWMTKLDASRYFESIDLMLETSVGNYSVTLCHYPLVTWKHEQKAYMIHGHIHLDTSTDFWPLLRARERVLNAGAEINAYRPVTLEELIHNNAAFKAASCAAEGGGHA